MSSSLGGLSEKETNESVLGLTTRTAFSTKKTEPVLCYLSAVPLG